MIKQVRKLFWQVKNLFLKKIVNLFPLFFILNKFVFIFFIIIIIIFLLEIIRFNFSKKKFLEQIPPPPFVGKFWQAGGKIILVGGTIILRGRWENYFSRWKN